MGRREGAGCPRKNNFPGKNFRISEYCLEKSHVSPSAKSGVSKLQLMGQIPASKIYWKASRLLYFCCVSEAAFLMAELSSYERDHMAHKVETVNNLALNRKNLSIPVLDTS